jgi:hypothetical protein
MLSCLHRQTPSQDASPSPDRSPRTWSSFLTRNSTLPCPKAIRRPLNREKLKSGWKRSARRDATGSNAGVADVACPLRRKGPAGDDHVTLDSIEGKTASTLSGGYRDQRIMDGKRAVAAWGRCLRPVSPAGARDGLSLTCPAGSILPMEVPIGSSYPRSLATNYREPSGSN